MSRIGLLGLAIGITVTTGCQSDRPEPGKISKEWSTNTSQLGIRPIYPPREVYPGDVWVSVGYNIDDLSKMPPSAFRVLPIRYSHLDLGKSKDEGDVHLSNPIKYPVDNSDSSAVPLKGFPGDDDRINCMVAFPGFSFASTSEFNLGANVPTGGWGGIFGFSNKSNYTVTYSVSRSECISFEAGRVVAKASAYLKGMKSYDLSVMTVASKMLTIPGDLKEKYDAKPIIVVPYEVYYARSLDVTINSLDGSDSKFGATILAFTELNQRKQTIENKILALGGKPEPASAEEGADEASAPVDAAAPASEEAAPAPEEAAPASKEAEPLVAAAPAGSDPNKATDNQKNQDQIASLQVQLKTVQQELNAVSKTIMPTLPGVTGGITRISATGVTLHQKFSIPVAIGYRSVQFEFPRVIIPKGPSVADGGGIVSAPPREGGGAVLSHPWQIKGEEKLDGTDPGVILWAPSAPVVEVKATSYQP